MKIIDKRNKQETTFFKVGDVVELIEKGFQEYTYGLIVKRFGENNKTYFSIVKLYSSKPDQANFITFPDWFTNLDEMLSALKKLFYVHKVHASLKISDGSPSDSGYAILSSRLLKEHENETN